MKNLFRLSDFYVGIFAFVLVLASCSRRDLNQGSTGKEKLEKLSAEIENSNAAASPAPLQEIEDVKTEEQNTHAVLGKIYSSQAEGIKSNVNSANAFKSMKETRQELK